MRVGSYKAQSFHWELSLIIFKCLPLLWLQMYRNRDEYYCEKPCWTLEKNKKRPGETSFSIQYLYACGKGIFRWFGMPPEVEVWGFRGEAGGYRPAQVPVKPNEYLIIVEKRASFNKYRCRDKTNVAKPEPPTPSQTLTEICHTRYCKYLDNNNTVNLY